MEMRDMFRVIKKPDSIEPAYNVVDQGATPVEIKVAVIEERLSTLTKSVDEVKYAVAASSVKHSEELEKAINKTCTQLMALLKEQNERHEKMDREKSDNFTSALKEQKSKLDPIIKWVYMVIGALLLLGILFKGPDVVKALLR